MNYNCVSEHIYIESTGEYLKITHKTQFKVMSRKLTSPIHSIIPSDATVLISREKEVRWRIDFASVIGNDKCPSPLNFGRVMSVSEDRNYANKADIDLYYVLSYDIFNHNL